MQKFPVRHTHFSPAELRCHCGNCDSTGFEMRPQTMEKFEKLREITQLPLIISSAYRCPEHNARVSSTGLDGPHTTGQALDLTCSSQVAYRIIKIALDLGFTGIGVCQTGPNRFIHLDDIEGKPRPNVWSY